MSHSVTAHVKIAVASVVKMSEEVAVDLVDDVLDVSVHRVVSDGTEFPDVGMEQSKYTVDEVAHESVAEDPLRIPNEECVFG